MDDKMLCEFSSQSVFRRKFIFSDVLNISEIETGFVVKTKNQTFEAGKIIIASGTISRKLGLNEEKFI